jgi:anti-sigma regulatory factor (Ser/Thr protein kinase)
MPVQLSLRIWDLGTPFDLSTAFNEIEKLNLSPLERDSQWGIIMLMKLQKNHGWHIQYNPVEKVGNCLLVCKSIINNTNLRTE